MTAENTRKRRRAENEVCPSSNEVTNPPSNQSVSPQVITISGTKEQIIGLIMSQRHVVELDRMTKMQIECTLRSINLLPSDLDTMNKLVDYMS